MHQQSQPIPQANPSPLRLRSQGAEVMPIGRGVCYRTWCKHDCAEVVILGADGAIIRSVPLRAEEAGYFSAIDERGAPGDLYKYGFGASQSWPDPASGYQPHGVHGPSMVVDGSAYRWN